MAAWSISEKQLVGPRKLGGRISKRGFAFQDAYSCMQLLRLLDTGEEVIRVRPEGAQDVDLLYEDGHEEYIQIKDEPDNHYSLVELRSILQGFALDLLEAGKSTTLHFILVARSNYVDAAVRRLRDKTASSKDISNIAQLLVAGIKGSPPPKSLVVLNKQKRLDLSTQLVKQTSFFFGMGDKVGERISFESHAYAELAKHGVLGSDLQSAFNAIKAALDHTYEFNRGDVEEILKRFIADASIDLFDDHVDVLTNDLLSSPADINRIQQFYAGAPLDWDIIAGQGDIPRDQENDLFTVLSNPTTALRVICIVAEPGSGKSTLAWRLAFNLHCHQGALVIHIRNNENPNVWYSLIKFYQKVRRPFYVLVDDLFRNSNVVEALRELSISIPITVLATARYNEFRPHRLKAEVIQVILQAPSSSEKDKILKRLGKTILDLTPEQGRRLDSANQFLVLMMELISGKVLREIVRDSIERLRILDQSAYFAYEYLCLFCMYGLSVPSSLLEHIDSKGRFHNLALRESSQGLVFFDDSRKGNIRAGHPLIAETAYNFYELLRSTVNVLEEIVTAVNPSNPIERVTVTYLFYQLVKSKPNIALNLLNQAEAVITLHQQQATISELLIWRSIYLFLKNKDKADYCVDTALKSSPISPLDCMGYFRLMKEKSREGDALSVLLDWLVQNPDDNYVRTAFLGLVERKGTTDQIENVLQETGKWLVQNPDDNSVRTAFLGLVERKGTTDQIENVLQETGKWLVQSPDDDSVRTAFLGLVERKGTTDQIENVLQETTSWLTHHNKAIGIWDALIALFVRLEKVEEAKNAIIEAISFNQDDLKLLDQYLRYFKNTGNEKTVKVIYEAQLKAYPNSLNIREHYAAWLREHNYLEDSKSQYEMLAHIAPKSFRARYGFGLLQLKLGDIDDAIEQFGECLKIHKGHVMAHLGLAQSFAEKTKLAKLDSRIAEFRIEFAKAEKEFNKAIYWAGINKNPQTLFHTQLGWFYIENDCYSEAKRTFELAMREDPEYFGNYWGIGHALMGLEQFREAEMALIMSLEKAPADFQAPASEKIPELLGKCQILLDDN